MLRKIAPIGASKKRPSVRIAQSSEMARAKALFGLNIAHTKGANGKIPVLKETTLYVSADVSGIANKTDLLTNETKAVVGITNFDGNKFNTGTNASIQAMRVLYSTSGETIQNADWQNEDRLPAELQNAEIVITQGGNFVLSMPLTDLQGDKFQAWRKFADTPFLKNNEPIAMQIQMPTGVTAPISDANIQSFLRLEFRVFRTKI